MWLLIVFGKLFAGFLAWLIFSFGLYKYNKNKIEKDGMRIFDHNNAKGVIIGAVFYGFFFLIGTLAWIAN